MSIEEIYRLYLQSPIISTDTRAIENGSIYFGLKGENFDGGSFSAQALEKGAVLVVQQNVEFHIDNDKRYILVDDALKTLQELAAFHRNRLKIPILAICGSNGKTTSKELISRVLAKKYRVFSTLGNLNNHIGVPLSILMIQPHIEFAVLELGANHQKEHQFLLDIARPDYVLVTNIGKDHLEGFGGIEGVEIATNEIFDYLRVTSKKLFLNLDDPLIMRNIFGIDCISFNILSNTYSGTYSEAQKGDYTGKIVSKFPTLTLQVFNNLNGEEIVINSHFFGTFNAFNMVSAACIGNHFGVSMPAIKVAVDEYIPQNNRSQLIEKDGNSYILDAYNANPSSMQGAVQDFMEFPGYNKIIIIGDMFEMGEASAYEHQAIVDLIQPSAFHEIIFVGEAFQKTNLRHLGTNKGVSFLNAKEAKAYLQEKRYRGMVFFLKGSRGMKLESIVD